MFIAVVIFAIVITVVYIIRQFSFEYALVISIGAGVVTNILSFLIADLKYANTVNIGTLILMSVVCGFIALIAEFMKRVLDYTAIERVQFEDDDYYYYVKAVPKVNVSIPRYNVKRMVDTDSGNEEEDDEESYADIHIVGNDDVKYEDYTEEDYNVDTDTSDDEEEEGLGRRFSDIKGKYAFDESVYSRRRSEMDELPGTDADPGIETEIETGFETEDFEVPATDSQDSDDDDSEVKYVDFDDDDFN